MPSIASRFRLGAVLVLACLAVAGAGHDRAWAAGDEGEADGPRLPVMIDARVVGDEHRVRFIADLSKTIDASVFTLADPYRIIIDLPEVRFALPAHAGSEPRGLAAAFRFGSISAGKSRIVIDMTGPVAIDKSFTVAPADGQPARLVVDVVPATEQAFMAATEAYRASHGGDDESAVASGPLGAGGDLPVIVLDPGHGGIDTGARGDGGTPEKEVVLSFAQVLGQKLAATSRYRVVFTRDDDTFVPLGERVNIARRAGARLFISVHANSFPGESIRGAIVYTVSDEASDKMAAQLAASENQSDVLAGIDVDPEDVDEVKDILIDLTRRETRNFGVVFAQNLVRELSKSTRMFKVPHQQAGFKVLEAPDVPSALIELGYLTNATDEKLMMSEEWQSSAADSVVEAIDDYFARPGTTKVAQP